MTKKLLQYFGWFCLCCILLIGKIFITEILLPARNQPQPTKPSLEFHLPQYRFFAETLISTREQPHPARRTTISYLIQQVLSSLAFTPNGKQLLGTNYRNEQDEIMRWDIEDGTAFHPIKNQRIRLLSDDGRYYVTQNRTNHNHSNQYLYSVSNQKIIARLPSDTKDLSLFKIIGGKHPFAIYFYFKMTKAEDYAVLFDLTRRYFLWDINAKHFVTETPHTTKLYDFRYSDPKDVTFSEDGTKIFSLWPTYTRTLPPTYPQIRSDKTITVTKNFVPWYDPNYRQKPKEASLLNEIDGSITKLPLPEESLDFEFGWINSTLSANGRYFAAASNTAPGGWSLDGKDGTIWCYDIQNRTLKWKYPPGKDLPDEMLFSPDGTMLASGGSNYDYRFNGYSFLNVIDVKTGKLLHSFTEQTLSQQIRDRTKIYYLETLLHLSFRFRHLTNIERWRDKISRAEESPAPGNSGQIQDIAWSPDSKLLAASYEDGSVKIWRVKE